MTAYCFSTKSISRRALTSPVFAAVLGGLIFLADLVSKYFTVHYLPIRHSLPDIYPYGGIGIFKNFLGIEASIVHATNRGAAWGILTDYQTALLILRILLVFTLAIYTCFFLKKKELYIPFTLIVVGAAGNIVDYFLYGHVIDMFHLVLWGYDYPVFNVADSAICIGILWLFIASFFDKGKKS